MAPTIIAESADSTEAINRLKRALAEAEERASSAEEMLQKTNLDKFNSEMTAFRKIRDLEAQIRDLNAKLKDQEAPAGTLKRADVESLLRSLCDELDSNYQHELAARKNLVEDLKRQLLQALQ
jgi:polyhydroxyalkanoate synthesis regulator phasin